MSGKYFLDTNVLVYTFDSAVSQKQTIATELVEKALESYSGIISYQVVQEFLNVSTRKFKTPMSVEESIKYLEIVLMKLCAIFPSAELYKSALKISNNNEYSFYDSLIIAAAIQAGCNQLYSEDLHDGHLIKGLKIINPFTK